MQHRLVFGAQYHPCGRGWVFRPAGGRARLYRHRHDRVGPLDGLSRSAGVGLVDQSDFDRGALAGLPLLLDMSTSTVALGKIMHAKDAGTAIPEGWAIDADGAPATDPAQVSTLTPLGGPKGSGLSLMIEVLSSVLCRKPGDLDRSGRRQGRHEWRGVGDQGRSLWRARGVLPTQIADLASSLKGLPKAPDTDEILLPGERGFRLAEERACATAFRWRKARSNGWPALADRFGVPQPSRHADRQRANKRTLRRTPGIRCSWEGTWRK